MRDRCRGKWWREGQSASVGLLIFGERKLDVQVLKLRLASHILRLTDS